MSMLKRIIQTSQLIPSRCSSPAGIPPSATVEPAAIICE
jgi:hypothetical protein